MLSNLTTKAYISVTEGIRRFKENQQGVTAIEYGLIAVAVAILIVAVFYNDNGFIQQLKDKFEALTKTINDAKSGLSKQ
ncbi:Flp family type IVb pilin [Actinobacillus pleuropneumoniae]|uniref:Flp operon protein Flp1 n=2 Tax=Actinobacillus pleuropneumoniae TaxID=715 RepID=H6TAL9_ACTPL|nr:Flp family type IVb pilin [Actinobacillus pleuropneumoniae]ACE61252.1 flp operon protein Flp1 [Actinobacillus pleuropneumoniae serovar 7 str. AP76]ADV41593.1 flp operon protein Flp1 [Actinobacillus pleuropneumoniae]ADY88140.1 flp operon protein Flp1 [Actinobacillus pleuropneumoniae]EFN03278.1 Flp operon protein Flp1 [Actinobacillus pleuropneumoniae serovar 13 str. N273]